MNKTKNYDLIDLLKFIGSLMIIAMHMSALDDINPQLQFYGVQLLTRWAVPFFFITSSFFLYRKSNGEPDAEHTKQYIKRILILYGTWFLVNIVSIIWKQYKAGFTSLSTWLLFIRNTTTGSVYTAAWYLLSSAFSAFLVYFLSKKFSDKVMVLATFLIYLFCIITSTYRGLLPTQFTDFLGNIMGSTCNHMISGCFYFALGKLAAKHYDKLVKIPRGVCLATLIVSYGLFYVEITVLKSLTFLGSTDASLLLIPAAFSLFVLTSRSNVHIRASKYLRKMSTFIFCSQGTVNLMACLAAKILQIPYNHVEFLFSFILMMILGSTVIWLQSKFKLFRFLT